MVQIRDPIYPCISYRVLIGKCYNSMKSKLCNIQSDVCYRANSNDFNKSGSIETWQSEITGCMQLLKVNYRIWYRKAAKYSHSTNGLFDLSNSVLCITSLLYEQIHMFNTYIIYNVYNILLYTGIWRMELDYFVIKKILMNLHFILCNGSIYIHQNIQL